MADRLTQEELDEFRDRAESGYGTATSNELFRLVREITALRGEVAGLLPHLDAAGFWEEQFQVANHERSELRARMHHLEGEIAKLKEKP